MCYRRTSQVLRYCFQETLDSPVVTSMVWCSNRKLFLILSGVERWKLIVHMKVLVSLMGTAAMPLQVSALRSFNRPPLINCRIKRAFWGSRYCKPEPSLPKYEQPVARKKKTRHCTSEQKRLFFRQSLIT